MGIGAGCALTHAKYGWASALSRPGAVQ